MRKQTKLVAVLSAAALLAMGASMTSFAAGWQKDDAGVWHYYDSDDEMVTGEWKKDGGKWFYLDEDGDMLTDAWVDDDYYVDESGAMLTNAWKYTVSDEDQDEPDEDGERWFYFNNKGKKVVKIPRRLMVKLTYSIAMVRWSLAGSRIITPATCTTMAMRTMVLEQSPSGCGWRDPVT